MPGEVSKAQREQPVFFHGALHSAESFYADELSPGDRIVGPAIVVQLHSTVVLEPGWHAQVLSGGEILATPTAPKKRSEHSEGNAPQDDAVPIQLEIFNNHFAGIAEQMGIALRNTAVSVNVKERLDYSCAAFDSRGELWPTHPMCRFIWAR